MSDLISRSALLEEFQFSLPINCERTRVIARCVETARKIINEAPAVDAVELVRCKDCVYRHTNPHCHGRRLDWYCPNGKRRRRDD